LANRLALKIGLTGFGFCRNPTPIIQGSDIFLLASVGEAGGFVLSEAMGCGTPIIGSRSGVISECVVEGETGLLATPKDPESFADAIEKFVRSPGMQETMRINSRKRMLENFTTDHNVMRTLQVYQSLWNQVGQSIAYV
jgi:glycosyltransferase involved in cell wall biosynthesis